MRPGHAERQQPWPIERLAVSSTSLDWLPWFGGAGRVQVNKHELVWIKHMRFPTRFNVALAITTVQPVPVQEAINGSVGVLGGRSGAVFQARHELGAADRTPRDVLINQHVFFGGFCQEPPVGPRSTPSA